MIERYMARVSMLYTKENSTAESHGICGKAAFLGKEYALEIFVDSETSKDFVQIKGELLALHIREMKNERIVQAMKRFYYQQGKSIIEKQIKHYQVYFKPKPRAVKISDNQNFWGLCDSKRQLSFNWRLAMAPIEVIDYIVVHEMCHMEHMNHDRSFWRLVGKIIPNYQHLQQWLDNSSWKMNI